MISSMHKYFYLLYKATLLNHLRNAESVLLSQSDCFLTYRVKMAFVFRIQFKVYHFMITDRQKICNYFFNIARKHLFFMFGKKTESELSKFRSLLVENFHLARIAKVGYSAEGIINVTVSLPRKNFVLTL